MAPRKFTIVPSFSGSFLLKYSIFFAIILAFAFPASCLEEEAEEETTTITIDRVPTLVTAPDSPKLRATCGFPGQPKHGRVLHLLERYEESMVVTYECDQGYFLLGPLTRTCLANGTWSHRMPICDQSVQNLGLTSASEALNNYPPQLAVDGNFRTCFFSNRRKPRWWRVELPESSLKNQSIISVALTLPPINAELFFSIYVIEIETLATINENETSSTAPTSSHKYHKCATFRGVFSSKTIFVQCATKPGNEGLKGHYLQIEDDYPQLEYFGLCEVDLFVQRDHYECGQPEVPANGFVVNQPDEQTEMIPGVVHYHCNQGYRLVGNMQRQCDTKTGQWIGPEPYCQRITCPEPTSVNNGFVRMYGDYYELPIVGTRAVYECRPGYIFSGSVNDTIVCDQDGQWSGLPPQCQAIDCGQPESLLMNSEDFFLSGAQFRLVNNNTKFSAIAELICSQNDLPKTGNQTKTSVLFRCREDGIWTEVNQAQSNETTSARHTTSCVRQRYNGFLYYYSYGSRNVLRKGFYLRDGSINIMHLLAAVVVAAFLSILIIVGLMFKRNIIEWPENHCGTWSRAIKSAGESIFQFFLWIYSYFKSHFIDPCTGSNSDDSEKEPPPFTVSSSVPDLEAARGENVTLPTSTPIQSPQLSHHQTNKKTETADLNTALATFYEEITNAAKQMFSEETDRKLLRAARIAAELDAIKMNQQHHHQQCSVAESNYHWIYGTQSRSIPPTSSSLPPSLHEYHQIPSADQAQIYAKVDLIRKHRYRKEKEISVYQVPRPRDTYGELMDHSGNYHRLRKALSTPDASNLVVIEGLCDDGQYATIRRLMSSSNYHQENSLSSPPHIHEPVNRNPLKTLL